MSCVRGVMIVAAGSDPARLHAALSLAAAMAALDRPARLFLQADAVALLRDPNVPRDESGRESGIPALDEMIAESLALGVTIIACQSGLALAGMSAGDLPRGVETGGLVGFLASQADEQLLMA
jgi:predicted peroxiredoxin